MSSFSLVLLSGGVGKRMQLNTPKQFLHLSGKPFIIHVLEKIEKTAEITEVIVPCPTEFLEETEKLIANYLFTTSITCIVGGDSRQASVYEGLKKVSNEKVIIHEAVRPFVSVKDFENLINATSDNAIYGIDIPFTVLQGRDKVEANLKREDLINVQLPHKYNRTELMAAHEKAIEDNLEFTEDASLHFHYHQSEIKVLKGNEYNIKITKPVDRVIAEAIYRDLK